MSFGLGVCVDRISEKLPLSLDLQLLGSQWLLVSPFYNRFISIHVLVQDIIKITRHVPVRRERRDTSQAQRRVQRTSRMLTPVEHASGL